MTAFLSNGNADPHYCHKSKITCNLKQHQIATALDEISGMHIFCIYFHPAAISECYQVAKRQTDKRTLSFFQIRIDVQLFNHFLTRAVLMKHKFKQEQTLQKEIKGQLVRMKDCPLSACLKSQIKELAVLKFISVTLNSVQFFSKMDGCILID